VIETVRNVRCPDDKTNDVPHNLRYPLDNTDERSYYRVESPEEQSSSSQSHSVVVG
jgi:hypothetical protein